MPLTTEEIQEINTAIEGGTYTNHAALAPLTTLGLVFRSAKDDGAYKKTVEDDVLKKREPEIHGLYESEVEAQSGIKKNNGEKGTDYLKRAFGGMKTELADLKEKGAGAGNTSKEKERITELEGLLATKDEEVKKTATDYNTKLTGYKVDGQIRAATAAVTAKLIKTLTGDAKDDVVEARVAKFRREYTPVLEGEGNDERVVWKKEDSFVNDTKGQRRTTESIMEEVFGSYVDKGKVQPGAGTNPDGSKKKEDAVTDYDTYAPGPEVTTKVALMADMQKQGLTKGTREFSATYKKLVDELKLK